MRAKVLRGSDRPDVDGTFSIALHFEKLSPDVRRSVFAILKSFEHEPGVIDDSLLPVRRERTNPPASPEPPVAAPASPEDRRKHRRGVFEREVVTLDAEARAVLMGRDLSVGGMSVEPGSGLAEGSVVRLAIYGAPREDPFIVRARVVRESGSAGMGLAFEDLQPGVAARLESLVANLPAVESLRGSESDAMGSIVSRILEQEGA